MKILMITNIEAEGSTGRLACCSLRDLGHEVYAIDTINKKIEMDFDMTIVWSNKIPDTSLLPKPTILYYIDDPLFWAKHNPVHTPENYIEKFDYIFTCNNLDIYNEKDFIWLPMGNLDLIHKKWELTDEEKNYFCAPVIFIGTNRGNRPKLIKKLIDSFGKDFKLWGNNWESEGIKSHAIYYDNYAKAISGSKVIITEHYASAPSGKDTEIPAVGGALMITDHPRIKKMYPMAPVYKGYDEAIELAKYYLEHEDERIKLVKEMQEIAYRDYSYQGQLKKMIEVVKNGNKM